MLHRRKDCTKAELWPDVEVLEEDEDIDGRDEQLRECVEEYGKSSVFFGTGDSSFTGDNRTFMHTMFECDLYDVNGDHAGIYMQVAQVFFCPFCGQPF